MGSRDSGLRSSAHATLPVIFGVALVTGFSGAVVPGSLLAVVVRETMRVGWTAGPLMMVGHGALELVAIVLLVTGLIKFARSRRVQGVIGLVGALVLLYMGYQTLSISGETGAEALTAAGGAAGAGGGWLRLAWLGALMSMANPYWWLWWATIGAAHSAWAIKGGRVGGGPYYVGHVLSDLVWYCAVSLALAAGRTVFSTGGLRGTYVACAGCLVALAPVFAVAAWQALRGAGVGKEVIST